MGRGLGCGRNSVERSLKLSAGADGCGARGGASARDRTESAMSRGPARSSRSEGRILAGYAWRLPVGPDFT